MRAEYPKRPPGLVDRREFLRLSGAGLAVMALFGTSEADNALAQEGSSLVEEVQEAAEKYRVPKELLLAMGYVNTHWEMPPPQRATTRRASSTARALTGSWPSSGTIRRTLWARPRG
jgi:hypothetical protein